MTPEALRAELKRLGLTQVAAAKLLNISDRYMRKMCAGAEIPVSIALLLPKMTKAEVARLMKATDHRLTPPEGFG